MYETTNVEELFLPPASVVDEGDSSGHGLTRTFRFVKQISPRYVCTSPNAAPIGGLER